MNSKSRTAVGRSFCNPPAIALAGLLATVFVSLTGCHLFPHDPSSAAAELDASVPVVSIEIHAEGKVPQQRRVPLTQPMTVQGAIQQAGLFKNLGDLDIQVVRAVGPQQRQVKMGVKYVKERRQIAAHTDYALMPNDRIVMTQRHTYPLEGLIGPLARILGTGS